jgi:hypothetical protein
MLLTGNLFSAPIEFTANESIAVESLAFIAEVRTEFGFIAMSSNPMEVTRSMLLPGNVVAP